MPTKKEIEAELAAVRNEADEIRAELAQANDALEREGMEVAAGYIVTELHLVDKQTSGNDAFGARANLKVGLVRTSRRLTAIEPGGVGLCAGFWVHHEASKDGSDARRLFIPAARVAAVEVG